MPAYVAANGSINEYATSENRASSPPTDISDHWLFEPSELMHWQGQLVDSCQAISNQLAQIHEELRDGGQQQFRVVSFLQPCETA